MKIFVSSKPNAKKTGIAKIGDYSYEIAVKEPPLKGKANTAIARALAKHFHVPPSNVRLASGARSKRKIFEIFEIID